jgi:hypothetical protein
MSTELKFVFTADVADAVDNIEKMGEELVALGETSKETTDKIIPSYDDLLEKLESEAAATAKLVDSFNSALNPSTELADRLLTLSAAGVEDADIMAVLGDEIKATAEKTREHGQEVVGLVAVFDKQLNATTEQSNAFASLGTAITDFVDNPLGSIKTGITNFLTTLGPTAVGVGAVATAIAAAGVAFYNFMSDAAAAAEELENMSAKTGLSVDKLAALKQIQKEAGLESIDLGRSLGKINEELGSDKPGPFTDAMKMLGVEVKDSSGKTKDAVTVLDEMRLVLINVQDPTERVQLAQQALGGRLANLIPLLLNSSSGIADMTDELIAQGVVVDDATHKKLLEFDNMLDQIDRVLTVLKSTFAEVGVTITDFLNTIATSSTVINTIGMMIAKVAGDEAGLKLYAILTGQAKSSTKALTDEQEASYNKMVTNRMWYEYDKLHESLTPLEEAQKKVREEFEKQATPASVIIAKIKELVDAHIPLNAAIKGYAGELVDAADKQLQMGGTFTATEYLYVARAKALNDIVEAQDKLAKSEKAMNDDLLNLGKVKTDYYVGVRDTATNALAQELLAKQRLADADANFLKFLDDKNKAATAAAATDTALAEKVAGVGEAMRGAALGTEILMDEQLKAADAAKTFDKEISTVWTNVAQGMADTILSGKDFSSTMTSIFTDMSKGILSSVIADFLSPLKKAFSGESGGGLSGAFDGIKGVFGDIKDIFTGGPLDGIMEGGTNVTPGVNSTYTGLASMIGGVTASLTGSTGVIGAMETMAGAAGPAIASLMNLGSAAGPVGLAISAAAVGAIELGKAIANWVSGPNSWEAAAKELTRDYGIRTTSEDIKKFGETLGIAEERLWGMRANFEASPIFLAQFTSPLAEAQGKTETFLKSLESIMGVNFRPAFEVGQITGDWTELNEVFLDVFGTMGGLSEKLLMQNTQVKDVGAAVNYYWNQLLKTGEVTDGLMRFMGTYQTEIEALIADTEDANAADLLIISTLEAFYTAMSKTKTATPEFLSYITQHADAIKDLTAKYPSLTTEMDKANVAMIGATTINGLNSLRGELAGLKTMIDALMPPVKSWQEEFVKTGVITDALADKVAEAGGDMAVFRTYADVQQTTIKFEELAAQFEKTGDAEDDLIKIMTQFGVTSNQAAGLTKDSFNALADIVRGNMSSSLVDAAGGVSSELSKMDNLIVQSIQAMTDAIVAAINGLPSRITAPLAQVQGAIDSIAQPVTIPVSVVTTYTAVDGGGWNGYSQGGQTTNPGYSTLPDGVITMVAQGASGDQIYAAFTSMYGAVMTREQFRTQYGYKYGTDYVPRDNWYYLHEGESVKTADETRKGSAPSVTVNINGGIFNTQMDFQQAVAEAVTEGWRRGGFSYLRA